VVAPFAAVVESWGELILKSIIEEYWLANFQLTRQIIENEWIEAFLFQDGVYSAATKRGHACQNSWLLKNANSISRVTNSDAVEEASR
jgi:hypothetical protein